MLTSGAGLRIGSMNYWLLLLIPLALAGFIGFWCLVVKLVALMGWQKLANHFQTASRPPGSWFGLGQAYIGSMKYQSVLEAAATPAGLALASGFPFGTGHPPLLIPWDALEPVEGEKMLWLTSYTTHIRTGDSGTTRFSFTSPELAAAIRPWLPVAEPR
ncbi:hypothetical protein [Hymenobacter lucidus]|uniref:DUF2550 family protein n=1 Tax=Hymenobacter lucidus TaxID=2880930 RepID=A0ABS8AP05_9BACT|nr:hypothetical protein [Hymenobacter lucidus]MCB2407915.1 hypothetical protein [Hymenobacter lucidus]